MSYENYEKNKKRVDQLMKSYPNLEKDKSKLKWGSLYECHCRCCEDVYFDTTENLKKRDYACKCGSWRLEIYESKKALQKLLNWKEAQG